ncbi:hypothetical protein DINM_002942 [Dirofilaria immitis]|nr:hypothetical protein [Dirofilaria immitis]
MSEEKNSTLNQFVVEISRRTVEEASTVAIADKSSTTSDATSITPLSTHSTDPNEYGSISPLSSTLSISSASLTIKSSTKHTVQQHLNNTVTIVDEKKRILTELCKSQSQLQASTNATVILNKDTVITIDRKEFAQISPYFRAAFYGGFLETKSRLLSFDRTKSEEFLHCCAILNQLMSENKWKVPNLQWMNLQKAFEILDIASYLLIDPLLTLISDVIISKVNADSLVLAYHKAENRHVPLAQKLWKIIVRQFDRLLVNNTFLALSETEILKLLNDKHLNINKNEETAMVRKWITVSAVRLREELYGRNDTVGFSENEPRLPNSVLLASGGWSNVGPTMLVETLDLRAQNGYVRIINTGEYLFTIGGFNGAEYYRSTRRFSLNDQECVEVAPMYDQRCYVGCGLLDSERIIAIGGYNNHDRLRSAEILHIPKINGIELLK